MNINIAPSLLSADFSVLKDEVIKLENSGADFLHLDIMDGNFVPNISFGAPVVKSIRKHTNMVFDVHLMISDPLKYIEDFVKAGADIITFHYESVENAKEVIDTIHSHGVKAGISVKPGTDIAVIDDLLDELELVLIMSVEPGFGGQSFMGENLEKVKYLREEKNYTNYISVDGGINKETAKLAIKAGADVLVAGTAIFSGENYKEEIDAIRG